MHASSDRSSEQVSQAVLGQVAAILDKSDGWLHIKTPDGYTGWVEVRWTIEDIRGRSYGSSGIIAKVANLFVDILDWPDPAAEIITKAVIGTELEVADTPDDWVIVRLPDGKPGAIRRYAVELTDRAVWPLPLDPTGFEIVMTAKRFIGVPYLWCGVTAFGLDCSGFVQLVHKLNGVQLPRDAYMQADDDRFGAISGESLMPGDLVFFGVSNVSQPRREITHTGIALGNGKFIHSSGGAGVMISELSEPRYAAIFKKAKRLI
ncbi:MAG: C40 family peptidase [Armatimonadota bacterium]|nr:C40 family peptidase [Armatimonadota bacterium]